MSIPNEVLTYYVENLITHLSEDDTDSRVHTYINCIADAIQKNRALVHMFVNGKTIREHILNFATNTYLEWTGSGFNSRGTIVPHRAESDVVRFNQPYTPEILLQWAMTDYSYSYCGSGAHNLHLLTQNTTKRLLRNIIDLNNRSPY
jgi:hypothetical protein